jgi:hypothetical protein
MVDLLAIGEQRYECLQNLELYLNALRQDAPQRLQNERDRSLLVVQLKSVYIPKCIWNMRTHLGNGTSYSGETL